MSTIIVLGLIFAILALVFFGMNQNQAAEQVKAKLDKEASGNVSPIWLAASVGGTESSAPASSAECSAPGDAGSADCGGGDGGGGGGD